MSGLVSIGDSLKKMGVGNELFVVLAEKTRVCEKHGIEYIEKQYKHFTTKCPKCAAEAERERLAAEKAKREQAERERLEYITKQRLGESGVPLRYLHKTAKSYQTQVGNTAQALVFAEMMAYTREFTDLKHSGRHLALLGNTGTGKTHLACAAARYVIQQGGMARFITLAELNRKVRESKGFGSQLSESEVIDAYANYDLLIIDEVGVQSGTDAEYRAFFEVFNERHNRMKPTILISNLDLESFKSAVSQRIFDRILEDGGRILGFNWESYRAEWLNAK